MKFRLTPKKVHRRSGLQTARSVLAYFGTNDTPLQFKRTAPGPAVCLPVRLRIFRSPFVPYGLRALYLIRDVSLFDLSLPC